MKKIAIGFAVSIIILLVLFISMVGLLRKPICKGRLLQDARPYIEIFFPPKNLFKNVLNEKIDITKVGQIQTNRFKLNYIGPYWASVVLDNLAVELPGAKYDLKLKIRMDFYKGDVLLVSKNTADYYDKSWGLQWGSGIIRCEFQSPQEIPIDTEIICKLTVLATDDYLNKNCGPVRLYISRLSQE